MDDDEAFALESMLTPLSTALAVVETEALLVMLMLLTLPTTTTTTEATTTTTLKLAAQQLCADSAQCNETSSHMLASLRTVFFEQRALRRAKRQLSAGQQRAFYFDTNIEDRHALAD